MPGQKKRNEVLSLAADLFHFRRWKDPQYEKRSYIFERIRA